MKRCSLGESFVYTEIMRNAFLLVGGALGLAVVVVAQSGAMRAFINGQPAKNVPIQQGGKWYVAVDDLKDQGAEVTVASGRVSVQFKPMRERLQSDGVEGVLGEWVQNERWRVRVTDVKPTSNPFGRGSGYQLTFEARNLGRDRVNFGTLGFRGMDLLDEEGNTLQLGMSSFKDAYTPLVQASGFKNDLKFGDRNNRLLNPGKPDRLVITWGPSGGKPALKTIRIRLKTD